MEHIAIIIIDVAINSPSAGVVNIYPLTKDGNPSEEILEIVEKYLNEDKIRPLTDKVQVLSPEKKDFSIIATIYLYQDADETSVMTTKRYDNNKCKIRRIQIVTQRKTWKKRYSNTDYCHFKQCLWSV